MKNKNYIFRMITCAALCGTSLNIYPDSFVTYSFENATPSDDSGKWNGSLNNNARIVKIGENHVLFTGNSNGYMDLGENAGRDFFSNVSDFTISFDLRSEKENNLNLLGNFICSFSSIYPVIWGENQNEAQYIFIGGKSVSYTINNKSYSTQESAGFGQDIESDVWNNITYVQKGNNGKLYIDGVIVGENKNITIKPQMIAENLKYNWLGRSCWGNDNYLKNAYIDNFRIYHEAISENDINDLCSGLEKKNKEFNVYEAIENIVIENLQAIKDDISLPLQINGYTIVWSSSDLSIIDNTGKVTRPSAEEGNSIVTLTASIQDGDVYMQKEFKATVIRSYSNEESVMLDFENLSIPEGYLNNAKWDIPLDTTGLYDSKIEWTSSDTEYLSNNGEILKMSDIDGEKVTVTLTANISSGNISKEKHFNVCIAYPEQNYDGYLFAYFEGSGNSALQEHLRFGASADAVVWKALNNNQPIIMSDTVSHSGGIRDPHILRGEDGKTFYLVATDMYVHQYGWTENPGIVLMKSDNLTDWSHSYINLKESFPENFGDAYWVWAPQTIYDPSAGKYMIYFTLKRNSSPDLITYYAYANSEFTAFENEPQILFSAKYGSIDNDIIYKDGLWHLFYKGNTKNEEGVEFINGIQQATSKSLHGEWNEDFIYLDVYAGKTPVEGSGIFKLHNTDRYVLMYDLYTSQRYEYQTSNDLYDFGNTSYSFVKDFNPRHGTVIGITKEEAKRLDEKWGGVPDEIISGIDNPTGNENIRISQSGNNVYVSSDKNTEIKIFDINGYMIKNSIVKAGNTLCITLRPGIYFLNNHKIIITKQ